jgi:hypothetical protein
MFVQVAFLMIGSLPEIAWLEWLNFTPDNASGTQCILELDAYQRFAMKAVWPLFMGGEIFVGMILHWLYLWWKRRKGNADAVFPRARYVRAYLALYGLSYMPLATAAIRYLKCENVGAGIQVLSTANGIVCGSPRYNDFQILAIFVVVVDVIAGPLIISAFLLRNRRKIQGKDKLFLAYYGVLFEAYTGHAFWFEAFGLLRRTAFVVVDATLFTDSASKFYSMMLLALGFFLIDLVVVPFNQPLENLLDRCFLVTLVILATTMIGIDTASGEKPQEGRAVLVFLLVIIPVCASLLLVLRGLYQKLQNRRNKRTSIQVASPSSSSPQKSGISLEMSNQEGIQLSTVNVISSSSVPVVAQIPGGPEDAGQTAVSSRSSA